MEPKNTNVGKRAAAEAAVENVKDGMVIGLGSGSTSEVAIRVIGEKVKSGLRVIGVATSQSSATLASSLNIPLSTLADHPELDLAIDGADEVELSSLDLIKGRGGALLREKIVASSARRFIIIVDESKLVQQLGAHGDVPVEIVSFAWESTMRRLQKLGWKPDLRRDAKGAPFVTDGGNYIADCAFEPGMAVQPKALALHNTVGVVEHGMFIGMAAQVYVGSPNGVRALKPSTDDSWRINERGS
jgi:ribose 5-phosphate isomerase A